MMPLTSQIDAAQAAMLAAYAACVAAYERMIGVTWIDVPPDEEPVE